MPPYDFSEMYGSQEGLDRYRQLPSSYDDFTVIGAGGGVMNPNTGEWRGGPNDTRNQPRPQILDGGWGNGNPPQGRGNDFWNSQGGTDYRQRVQDQRQQELASMQQDQPQLPPAGGGEDYRQQERELLQQQEQQFPQGRLGWGSEGPGGFDGRAEERARQGYPWLQQQPPGGGGYGSNGEWQSGGQLGGGGNGTGTQGGRVGSPWGGGGYDAMQFGPGNYAGGGGYFGPQQQGTKWRDWIGQNGETEMTREKWDAMPPEMQQQWQQAQQGRMQPQQGGGWSNNNVATVATPEQSQQAISNNRTAQGWYDAEARGQQPAPMFGGQSFEQVTRQPGQPQSNTIGGGTRIGGAMGVPGGLPGAAAAMGGGIGGAMKGMFGFGGGNKSPQSGVGSFLSNLMNKNKALGSASSQGGPWSSMIGGAASIGPAAMKKSQGLQPGPSAQPPMSQPPQGPNVA